VEDGCEGSIHKAKQVERGEFITVATRTTTGHLCILYILEYWVINKACMNDILDTRLLRNAAKQRVSGAARSHVCGRHKS